MDSDSVTGSRAGHPRRCGRGAADALLTVRTAWVDGPRNEAWEELWRRLFVAVIRRLEAEGVEGPSDGYDEQANRLPISPDDG